MFRSIIGSGGRALACLSNWGMYALWERGEQVLFREHLTPSVYRQRADEFCAPAL